MVDKNTSNTYFNAFVKEASQVLKTGVGIIMSFYGFTNGCIIKIDLKTGVAHHCEDKQKSEDISEALFKTKLLPKETCDIVKGKVVASTMVVIPTMTCYVVFKADDETEWTEEAAQKDFHRIMEKVLDKYGRK